jgi:hypothetical protein
VNPEPCVRCGREPRDGETFLCVGCLQDPVTHQETAVALDAGEDLVARRFAVERFHWAGGWGRHDGGIGGPLDVA